MKELQRVRLFYLDNHWTEPATSAAEAPIDQARFLVWDGHEFELQHVQADGLRVYRELP